VAFFVLGGHGEEFLISAGLGGAVAALAAVVEDGEGRRAFPLRQFPGEKRVLRFGVADEVSVLFTVILLPFGEQLVAMAVAQLVQK